MFGNKKLLENIEQRFNITEETMNKLDNATRNAFMLCGDRITNLQNEVTLLKEKVDVISDLIISNRILTDSVMKLNETITKYTERKKPGPKPKTRK